MSDAAPFLGYESTPLASAIFSLIPAPYEATATYVSGQSAAPRAILDASSQIEDYDEESGLTLIEKGVHFLSPDEAPQDGKKLEAWVKDRFVEALHATAVPVILGGEGTVTLWGVEALLPRCEEVSILHLDAHADLNDPEEGEEESHRTVMRRILELKPQPHICAVGVRSLSRAAFDRIVDENLPVECFFMSDLIRVEDESWHEDVIRELRSPVFLSIDMSVFDPSLVPAVANPEPGGFTWWQMTRFLKMVAARRRIAAISIVELCPREEDIVSDYVTARLLYKLMNYIYAGGKMLEKPVAS